jgi:hypothetical protein
LAKDRGEQFVFEMTERDQEQRERESQESPRTKYEEAVERESEERAAAAERLEDVPPPREDSEDD